MKYKKVVCEETNMDRENFLDYLDIKDICKCPNLKSQNCHCLENFAMNCRWKGHLFKNPAKAILFLIRLKYIAQDLSKKVHSDSKHEDESNERSIFENVDTAENVSRQWAGFVLKTYEDLHRHNICEAGCTHILFRNNKMVSNYSRNVKKNKNVINKYEDLGWRCRQNLLPLKEMVNKICCKRRCTQKIKKNFQFYENLRNDSDFVQLRRKAAATLLKQENGIHTHCLKFIVALTGISRVTLRSIKNSLPLTLNYDEDQTVQITFDLLDKMVEDVLTATDNPQEDSPKSTLYTDLPSPLTEQKQQVQPNQDFTTNQLVNHESSMVPTPDTQQMYHPVNGEQSCNLNSPIIFYTPQVQPSYMCNPNYPIQGQPYIENGNFQSYIPNQQATYTDLNYMNIGFQAQNDGNYVMYPENNNYILLMQNPQMNTMNQLVNVDASSQIMTQPQVPFDSAYTTSNDPPHVSNQVNFAAMTPYYQE